MVGFGLGCAKEGHDGIADVLVQGAAPAEDLLSHGFESAVQDVGEFERLHAFAHAGEAADIGEEYRDLAALGLQGRRFKVLAGLEDLTHHSRRVIALEALAESRFALALNPHGGEVGHG